MYGKFEVMSDLPTFYSCENVWLCAVKAGVLVQLVKCAGVFDRVNREARRRLFGPGLQTKHTASNFTLPSTPPFHPSDISFASSQMPNCL